MNFSIVLIGTGVLSAAAVILGLAISLVTQFFFVKVDPRIEEIYEILPHFNCGACGCPGCMPYAEAVANEGYPQNKCVPGRQAVADKIHEIMSK